MTNEMRTRYRDQPETKFITITNGFDSADLNRVNLDPTHFSIRHIGSLYAGRDVSPFLEGLLMALQRVPNLRASLRVEFCGVMDRSNQDAWDGFVHEHDLDRCLFRHDFVPREQAIRLMQQAQVQLLILGEGVGIDRIYPAKLFEYLGTQRPILAMATSGLTASLVKELEAGVVADPADSASVAEAILTLHSWFQEGKLENWVTKGVQTYERRHLTGQLASVLDAVAANR
jgi:glycosyltransferase involved in cell wall biosynthesis